MISEKRFTDYILHLQDAVDRENDFNTACNKCFIPQFTGDIFPLSNELDWECHMIADLTGKSGAYDAIGEFCWGYNFGRVAMASDNPDPKTISELYAYLETFPDAKEPHKLPRVLQEQIER